MTRREKMVVLLKSGFVGGDIKLPRRSQLLMKRGAPFTEQE